MKTNKQARKRATDWASTGRGRGFGSLNTQKQTRKEQVKMDYIKPILMNEKAVNGSKQLSRGLSTVAEKYASSVNRKVAAHVQLSSVFFYIRC